MLQQNETAAPMGSSIGSGGEVTSIGFAAGQYLNPTISATDLAAAIIGARFGLSACVARLVVQLAGIGGRASL